MPATWQQVIPDATWHDPNCKTVRKLVGSVFEPDHLAMTEDGEVPLLSDRDKQLIANRHNHLRRLNRFLRAYTAYPLGDDRMRKHLIVSSRGRTLFMIPISRGKR